MTTSSSAPFVVGDYVLVAFPAGAAAAKKLAGRISRISGAAVTVDIGPDGVQSLNITAASVMPPGAVFVAPTSLTVDTAPVAAGGAMSTSSVQLTAMGIPDVPWHASKIPSHVPGMHHHHAVAAHSTTTTNNNGSAGKTVNSAAHGATEPRTSSSSPIPTNPLPAGDSDHESSSSGSGDESTRPDVTRHRVSLFQQRLRLLQNRRRPGGFLDSLLWLIVGPMYALFHWLQPVRALFFLTVAVMLQVWPTHGVAMSAELIHLVDWVLGLGLGGVLSSIPGWHAGASMLQQHGIVNVSAFRLSPTALSSSPVAANPQWAAAKQADAVLMASSILLALRIVGIILYFSLMPCHEFDVASVIAITARRAHKEEDAKEPWMAVESAWFLKTQRVTLCIWLTLSLLFVYSNAAGNGTAAGTSSTAVASSSVVNSVVSGVSTPSIAAVGATKPSGTGDVGTCAGGKKKASGIKMPPTMPPTAVNENSTDGGAATQAPVAPLATIAETAPATFPAADVPPAEPVAATWQDAAWGFVEREITQKHQYVDFMLFQVAVGTLLNLPAVFLGK